jgi:hypothetical protein
MESMNPIIFPTKRPATWVAAILIGLLILGAALSAPSVILVRANERASIEHDLRLIDDATTTYAERR